MVFPASLSSPLFAKEERFLRQGNVLLLSNSEEGLAHLSNIDWYLLAWESAGSRTHTHAANLWRFVMWDGEIRYADWYSVGLLRGSVFGLVSHVAVAACSSSAVESGFGESQADRSMGGHKSVPLPTISAVEKLDDCTYGLRIARWTWHGAWNSCVRWSQMSGILITSVMSIIFFSIVVAACLQLVGVSVRYLMRIIFATILG